MNRPFWPREKCRERGPTQADPQTRRAAHPRRRRRFDIASLLVYNLESEGYLVESAHRRDDAEVRLAELSPDLVILDWMLPGVTGIEICARLRACDETRSLPVIMLTARGEEAARVQGFSAGADDYVVKPFSVAELMARVRGLLRRSRPEPAAEFLVIGDIALDRANQRVRRVHARSVSRQRNSVC